MKLENARRNKKALTDPAYTTGKDNEDLMSGLRWDTRVQFLSFFHEANSIGIAETTLTARTSISATLASDYSTNSKLKDDG